MKLISKASECSIRIFISCEFDNNLGALIIEGEPAADELLYAWDNILTEFIDLSGTEMPEITKQKKINALYSRIERAKSCFFILNENIRYIKTSVFTELLPQAFEAIERLRKIGISLVFNNDINDLHTQVQNAQTREKLKEVQLEELLKDFNQFITDSTANKKVSYSIKTFYEQLNSLEALGFKIDEERTSVARLAVMISSARQMTNKVHTN